MRKKDLVELLKGVPDEAIVQVNVSDHAETLGLSDISIDKEYDVNEAFVLNVNIDEIDESLFFDREKDF